MEYRDKSNYDDLGGMNSSPRYNSNKIDKKSRRIIVLFVTLGVVLCLAVVVLWLAFFARPKAPAPSKTPSIVVERPLLSADQTTVEVETERREVTTPEPGERQTPLIRQTDEVSYTQHQVGEGESLESISQAYGISKETILSMNAIKNLSTIRPPLILTIPDRDGQLYTVQEGDSLSIITKRFNPDLGWKTLQQLNALKSEVIFPGQKLFIPSAVVGDDGSLASFDRFIRPAQGRITGLYGQPTVYGTSETIVVLQGIWIENSVNTPVTASSTGVVVDVGNEIDSRGKFIVLSHDYGYKTTYSHLQDILVSSGDTVKQGETIGTMGSSGNIGKNALYFTIEQEGVALNPANFF
ncbi:MAG: peptidoglycan DD-metalloendopeptidase family protein [Sphaerochaetaceae bacterium]|jgi:lipoprotein NlpD